MGDLISRLQGDRVTLWRADVRRQHGTGAPLAQGLLLREHRGCGEGAERDNPGSDIPV